MKHTAKSPALSLILCSRNDRYMGNSVWRLATALNYLAQRVHAQHLERDVEVVVADWGSEQPLRDVLELNPEASQLARFLHVPREMALELQRDSPFPEVLALNAAARRARGEYIGRIDQDTLVGAGFLRAFFEMHRGERRLEAPLASALLFSGRRDIPYRFAARCPPLWAVERFVERRGGMLPVEGAHSRGPFYCRGVGIWLAHHRLWHECGGYDERMIYMNNMEIDMIDRLRKKHVPVDLGRLVDYDFYHMEHYHPLEPRKSRTHRKVNAGLPPVDPDILNPNGANWGLMRFPLATSAQDGGLASARSAQAGPVQAKYLFLISVAGVQSVRDDLILVLRRISRGCARFGRHVFSLIFRPDLQTECEVTLATRGLIPALEGTRHLRAEDRFAIATRLKELLGKHAYRADMHKGVVEGTRYFLRSSARADPEHRSYLISRGTELLRQHADQSDLFQGADTEFSPAEIARVENSHLFDSTWRLLVPMFLSRAEAPENLKHVYCFGCAGGGTVAALKFAFDAQGLRLPYLNLFDSFAGLPAEQHGIATNSFWRKSSISFGPARLLETLRSLGIAKGEFEIHEGFYCDTLTSQRAMSADLQAALYVDIDCNLYLSTYQALDFMFAHNLATTGTYIGYDDWGDTREWVEGESRAHKEIAEKYGVQFRQCFSWGRAPVVRKLFRVLHRDSRYGSAS